MDYDEPLITRLARAAVRREDEERADRLLVALSREGFELPFMARASDYLAEGRTYSSEDPEFVALKAADDEAWRENRAALLRALASAISTD